MGMPISSREFPTQFSDNGQSQAQARGCRIFLKEAEICAQSGFFGSAWLTNCPQMLDCRRILIVSFVLIKRKDMDRLRSVYQAWIFPFGIAVSSSLLFFASLYSFLLFHTLVELFTVVIAFGIFVIAWSSRRYVNNIFLLLIGVSYLFIGGIDLVHMITYRGMDIVKNYGANLPTQLWIAARYLEAASFVAAFLLLKEAAANDSVKIGRKSRKIFFIYFLIFSAILALIFLFNIFPAAYVEGSGMTHFKIYSEYIISLIFFGAIILLLKKRKMFDREMANMLSLSLIMKIVSELAFTEYVGVYDFSNILGHIFRFISVLLLYKAVLESGLMRPYEFLFSDLKKSEERYRSLVDFSPDAIVVHSEGKVMYANGSAKKLFGIKKEDAIIGMELAGFFSPEYREQISLRIKNIFSGKLRQTPMTEMTVLQASGQLIPVEVKGMKIFYAGKEAVESIIRDVSERKKAEEKIRSLAKFPEENPNPVIRALADGQVQYLNQPARKMLISIGWTESGPLPEFLFAAVRQVLEKKVKQEVEVVCQSGQIFSIMLAPILTESWVNLYGLDITERKASERELANTQAELRKKTEELLMESYKHLGLVNRKISLLLELENHSQSKKNKQEIIEYILSSLLSLSYAKTGLLYLAVGKNHFNLVSSIGLEKENKVNLQIVNESSANFISKLAREGKRVNGSCDLVDFGFFNSNTAFSYCVALPILSGKICKGFLFLGFIDRKSMDMQELEFLDVFAKHVSSALANSDILN